MQDWPEAQDTAPKDIRCNSIVPRIAYPGRPAVHSAGNQGLSVASFGRSQDFLPTKGTDMSFFGFGAFSTPVGQLIGKL